MAQTIKNLLAVRETRKAHQHLLSSINRRGYSVNRNENYDLPEPLIMNIIKKKKTGSLSSRSSQLWQVLLLSCYK